jgi:hypothetical protein
VSEKSGMDAVERMVTRVLSYKPKSARKPKKKRKANKPKRT